MGAVHFTQHAKDKFKERFPCRVEAEEKNVILALCRTYYKSAVDNGIKNDTHFMTYIYEKHGYDDYLFSIFEDVIFVVKNECLVTVLPNNSHVGKRLTKQFKKKIVNRQRRHNFYRR